MLGLFFCFVFNNFELRPTFWRRTVVRPDLRLVSGQVTQWSVRLDLGLVDSHSVVSQT